MTETTVVQDTNKQLEELVQKAMFRLGQFFKTPSHETDDRADAKIAIGVLTAWARNNQNKIADRSLTVAVAKELGLNKDQFAQVVKETMPHLGITRLLKLPIEEEVDKLKQDNARLSEVAVNLQQQLARPEE